MAYPNGSIPLTGNIGTTAITDTFPTHIDNLGCGGLMTMTTVVNRNAIPTARRKFGMQVSVTTDSTPTNNKVYILANLGMGGNSNTLSDNLNWIDYSSYIGAGSPFKYNANGTKTGIEPCLGGNTSNGAYSIIGGGINNNLNNSYSIIGGGKNNCNTSAYGVIVGGRSNYASSDYSVVTGGHDNNSSNINATIGGGYQNISSGSGSVISGGRFNQSTGAYSTVGGGSGNVSTNDKSTVGGGYYNCSQGLRSTIGGGNNNFTNGDNSTIGGGNGNKNYGYSAVISGGSGNLNYGCLSIIGGGNSNVISSSSFNSSILGGVNNNTNGYNNVHIIGSNLTANQQDTTFTNCISAGNLTVGCFVAVGHNGILENYPTVPYAGNIMIIGAGAGSTERCGLSNYANGDYSTVSGGKKNSADITAKHSTIAGGENNHTFCNHSAIAGGIGNCANGVCSFIGGGYQNLTSNFSTVGGGRVNHTYGQYNFIGGGQANRTYNTHSIVIGGCYNINFGECSSIIGGTRNQITQSYACLSVIGGGYCNVITVSDSFIGGGVCNTINSKASGVLGGCNNTINSIFGQSFIIGNDITSDRICTTFVNNLSIKNIPSSSIGLPSGSVWSNLGILTIVP